MQLRQNRCDFFLSKHSVIAPLVGQLCQGLLRLAWGLKPLRVQVKELCFDSLRFTLTGFVDTRLRPRSQRQLSLNGPGVQH